MFISRHCHVFWAEKEKFSEKFSSFSEHREARCADGIATVHPNGFMAGSGTAVHERVRRGTESGISDGRRPSVLLSLLMHVSSSVAAPSSRSLRFMMSFSFPFSGKGSRAWLPRRRMPSFPLPVIVKTLMKSGLWPAGGTGERDSRPESAFWEVPVCVWGRNAEPFVPARPGREEPRASFQQNVSLPGGGLRNQNIIILAFSAFFIRQNEIQGANPAGGTCGKK